ncbi:hypothetical protein [Mycobacteroides abscessus]|uniref:hypothetical protein n=1 Tax=Mycobacteroides abscessus TaxID=36809 RepID=UPI000929E9E2|nr:hypothetical protein [Mycobacteroides abscessus]SHY10959.1 Uncharacterised protein [Mycobacteroides abscessus subsp. abscessus]SID58411.1 Uncharacterised protein [Mycobacteroides abscessus subsp. abscessus]SIN12229.1 Uncharacterised protein [Mycobacteroides abscessus subsp. abscessus]SKO43723.1 Uncharacterised protein [Mycobacteroides abscessus subsp. abscessus]SLJ20354.1 Uncharacterised protein [Mycobacteroides abscessus subsp. abscessus]
MLDDQPGCEIVELDDFQAREMFDHVCRSQIGLSGAEFIERYQSGEYDDVDPDSIEGLPTVLCILPFAGTKFR